MDKSKCCEIVDANIEGMKAQFNLQQWRIQINYEPLEEYCVAQCFMATAYQRATIKIDPEQHETEDEVVDSLRHELLHIVLAPYNIYRSMVTPNIEKDSAMDTVEEEAWTVAIESAVLNLERIMDRLKQ